ncbi:MAG: preprotein translocase subunit SecA [bacterium]|jgi:preprotein translocase subunit SecA
MFSYLKKKIFGTHSDKKLKQYLKTIEQIGTFDEQYNSFQEKECKDKTEELKKRLTDGASLDDLVPEAFALVRRAAMNTLEQRHYDVQVVGALALHDGQIAEMKTGEGKTLTSTLAVYLNAITGKGVHVVTVNDYLAKRDAEWMGKIYNYLGLSVGLIIHGIEDEERRAAYAADVTYGTNNEFGFDYLRDNMKFELEEYVQRGHYFAIVDEVDSILIDEARTPLIISGASEDSIEQYDIIDKVMYGLLREYRVSDAAEPEAIAKAQNIKVEEVKDFLKEKEDRDIVIPGDYQLDEKTRNIQIAEGGVEKMEERLSDSLKSPSLYDFENIEILHHVNQALKARYVFKRDIDYVVSDGQVIIVDEFTGRQMEGRRFSDGLHQALESKERVTIEQESQTLASITFQNYFRKYEKLSGMTGTALTEETEFGKIYGLGVIVIPTNKEIVRKDHADVIYKTKEAKYRAIVAQIEELQKKKQPVLVGAASIEGSELVSALLKKKGIEHNVLNAKHHEKEADVIAAAGTLGTVTIATNMAGRGTDIQLEKGVIEKGGLFILGTERNESRRVDNQLRGRAGRQGDPGESRFYLSLDDDLLRVFGGEKITKMMNSLKMEEDEAIEHFLITKAIENSQKQVEAQNFEIRKHLLEYDDAMNRQRDIIYKQRREILGEEIEHVLLDMAEDVVDDLFEEFCNEKFTDQWDIEGLQKELDTIFQITSLPAFSGEQKLEDDFLRTEVMKSIHNEYEVRGKDFGEYQKMIERHILLETTDSSWKDHLLQMDHLKEGISLRGYAQKNPLDEYKKEAYYLFQDLMKRIARECLTAYFHVQLQEEPQTDFQHRESAAMQMVHDKFQGFSTMDEAEEEAPKQEPRRVKVKIGRNDKCPCGSGKKYKSCHMKEYEAQEQE